MYARPAARRGIERASAARRARVRGAMADAQASAAALMKAQIKTMWEEFLVTDKNQVSRARRLKVVTGTS